MHTFKAQVIVSIIILFITQIGYSQSNNQDTEKLKNICSDFIYWYISVAKDTSNKYIEYNPIIVEDKNGMAKLDFNIYIKNLKKYQFSDSLIKQEIEYYNTCNENLSKIKYSDFLKFEDLSDYENIDCNYGNMYRWTGGQEMFDIYKIAEVKREANIAYVIGYLSFENDKNYKRKITISLYLEDNKWKILQIK